MICCVLRVLVSLEIIKIIEGYTAIWNDKMKKKHNQKNPDQDAKFFFSIIHILLSSDSFTCSNIFIFIFWLFQMHLTKSIFVYANKSITFQQLLTLVFDYNSTRYYSNFIKYIRKWLLEIINYFRQKLKFHAAEVRFPG